MVICTPHGQQELDNERRGSAKSSETQVWIQIGTVAEAGGHGRAKDAMGLMTLFPEAADGFAGYGNSLIAAGGIADGRVVAAAFCLGASGVVMGTRFLASTEARISKGYRDAVVQATEAVISTTRTLLYNHLHGTYGWPEPFSPRIVTNRHWENYVAGIPFDELRRLHGEAQAKVMLDGDLRGDWLLMQEQELDWLVRFWMPVRLWKKFGTTRHSA
ncbi:nitronate monooxygenase [Aspergillus chevalieri]|uniref:Nitronate monooxygenase domain-containing protein n=1 Tax=Aspergillus chevalieri TaxID=182096 RepID=A0A7R7VV42_ASPCH|nr:uncharacterized protein ACHE_60585S [Aspergillus chevalieri]BCR90699.1 hypothetical protein ACHE_60585S [Aspergillus chevalieri]